MGRYTETINYNDMKNFFDKCPDEYYKRIAKGLYYTGARIGELILIKQNDVQSNNDFLIIRLQTEKNPHAPIRYVPINPLKEPNGKEVFDYEKNEYLFPQLNKKHKLSSHLRIMRKKFNKYWGVAPHYFRHCRLTHMVTEFDFNDQELVKYAGWTDSKPAKWYVSLKTTDLQKKMM